MLKSGLSVALLCYTGLRLPQGQVRLMFQAFLLSNCGIHLKNFKKI